MMSDAAPRESDTLTKAKDAAAQQNDAPAAGTKTANQEGRRVPEWFPGWAARLSHLYFSGTTSMFVLHGNVQDLVRTGDAGKPAYGGLADFLAAQVFGRWDLILHYDLATGLRAFASSDGDRLKEMVARANRKVGDLAAARKDPATAFAMLDRFVQNNVMAAESERISAAVLIDYASFLVPAGEPG